MPVHHTGTESVWAIPAGHGTIVPHGWIGHSSWMMVWVPKPQPHKQDLAWYTYNARSSLIQLARWTETMWVKYHALVNYSSTCWMCTHAHSDTYTHNMISIIYIWFLILWSTFRQQCWFWRKPALRTFWYSVLLSIISLRRRLATIFTFVIQLFSSFCFVSGILFVVSIVYHIIINLWSHTWIWTDLLPT